MPASMEPPVAASPETALPAAVPARRLWVRRLATVALFIALAFLGDRLLAWGLDAITIRSQTRFSFVYRGNQDYDVLILGDSRAVNAFYAPGLQARLGGRWLNLAHNALSAQVAEAILRDYLDLNRPPRAVVLEVSAITMEMTPLSNLKMFWPHSARLRELARQYVPQDLHACQFTHLYYYDAEMFYRVLYYLNRSDQTWINRYTITDALYQQVLADPPDNLSDPRASELAALRRIVDLARERGIVVRCVIAPFLPPFREKLTNYDHWKAQIEAALGPDVRLWDFSLAVRDPQSFADRVHLNERGAAQLVEAMIADGFFADVLPPQP